MKKFTLGLHIFLYFLLMGLSTVQSYAADVKPADLFGKWKFTSKMEMTEFGKDYADDVFQESEVVIAKDESGYFSFGVTGVAGANTNPQMATFSAEDNTIKITNPNGNNGTWESPNLNFSNTDGVFPWGGYTAMWYGSLTLKPRR